MCKMTKGGNNFHLHLDVGLTYPTIRMKHNYGHRYILSYILLDYQQILYTAHSCQNTISSCSMCILVLTLKLLRNYTIYNKNLAEELYLIHNGSCSIGEYFILVPVTVVGSSVGSTVGAEVVVSSGPRIKMERYNYISIYQFYKTIC